MIIYTQHLSDQWTSSIFTTDTTNLTRTPPMQARICVFILIGFFFTPSWVLAEKTSPNILFILSDQWRAQSIGYAGNQQVKTPHIVTLAKQSVNFINAVSGCPVCCPYRASLLTGAAAFNTWCFFERCTIAVQISHELPR